MGRVYNALLKADRLSSDRPIGQRANRDAGTESPANAQTPRRRDAAIDSNARPAAQFNRQASRFDGGGAAKAPTFDLDNLFPETQTTRSNVNRVAAPSTSQKLSERANQAVACEQAQVAASPQFEEPAAASLKTSAIDPHLAAVTESDQLAAERYRTLAVRLANLATRRKLKSIAVTSAEAGEGKTTVAINLAWVMSKRAQGRVLLVDANLNYPHVARALGVAPTYGWLDFAEGKSKLVDSIIRLDPNGLYLAAPRAFASDESSNTDELASSHIEKLIAAVSAHFDFVVIDSPALLESADAQQLVSIADGAIVVARAGHTHHERVSDAAGLIPEDRRLGVVLNESELDTEQSRQDRSKGRLFGLRAGRARTR